MPESFRFYKKIRLFTFAFNLSTNTYYCIANNGCDMTNRAKKTKSIDMKQQRFKSDKVCGKSKLAGFFFRSVLFGRHVRRRFIFWWVCSDLRARLFLFRNIGDGHLFQFDPSSTGWLASISVNGGWQQQFQTFSQVLNWTM